MLLERGRTARKRPAGSDEIAEGIHGAAGLPQDLRPGVQVMRAEISRQPELVRAECPALRHDPLRLLLDPLQIFARDLPGLGAGHLIHQDDLGPQGPHHARPLRGIPLRHDGDEGIALDPAHDRQAGAGVPAGQLHHGLPRSEQAVRLRVLDDLAGDPVLLGEPRVEMIQLGQDGAVQVSGEPGQPDERRIADRLDRRAEHAFVPSHVAAFRPPGHRASPPSTNCAASFRIPHPPFGYPLGVPHLDGASYPPARSS